MEIRDYKTSDETSWLRCRVLSFLDTAYYDNVLQEKETYEHPSIELVAVENDKVIGLIDIAYEVKERTVCSRGSGLGAMIWHVAVHPDFQQKGIGAQLLQEAEKRLRAIGINRLEAWTRDDEWVLRWYEKNAFRQVDSYLHVYADANAEPGQAVTPKLTHLYPVQVFAHYTGQDEAMIRKKFKRVHQSICYEKKL